MLGLTQRRRDDPRLCPSFPARRRRVDCRVRYPGRIYNAFAHAIAPASHPRYQVLEHHIRASLISKGILNGNLEDSKLGDSKIQAIGVAS